MIQKINENIIKLKHQKPLSVNGNIYVYWNYLKFDRLLGEGQIYATLHVQLCNLAGSFSFDFTKKVWEPDMYLSTYKSSFKKMGYDWSSKISI